MFQHIKEILKRGERFPYINGKTEETKKYQALAGEIYEGFHRQISYPAIMNIIRNKGDIAVRQAFERARKAESSNRLKKFLYEVGQNKINWEE